MSHKIFAGVDVGGTNIKVGLVDSDGKTLAHSKFPTSQEKGPEFGLQRAQVVIEELRTSCQIDSKEVVAVGIVTPGPLDIASGTILTPFNLPAWRHFKVRDTFAAITGLPVSFANDAGAAALGEYWVGSGKEYDSVVLITLGTGVGGGIIINGVPLDGANSHGAEIGHMIVDGQDTARICSCGNPGHLEAYASATAVVARCQEQLASGAPSVLSERISEASPLTALAVAEAAAAGDALALDIVSETARYLAMGVASVAHIVDPEAVLLGGAMNFGGPDTPLGRRFLGQIREEVAQSALPIIAENLTIEFANLGSHAGFVGAAALARRDYINKAMTTLA